MLKGISQGIRLLTQLGEMGISQEEEQGEEDGQMEINQEEEQGEEEIVEEEEESFQRGLQLLITYPRQGTLIFRIEMTTTRQLMMKEKRMARPGQGGGGEPTTEGRETRQR